MILSTAQLDALPPGSAVRCTTERGRRTSLALKLGGYGLGANSWVTTDGTTFPSSFAIAQADAVLLVPAVVDEILDTGDTLQAITAANAPEYMTTWWDHTTWLPFVESDDGDITGPGHQDRHAFAAAVTTYDQAAVDHPLSLNGLTSYGDVSHEWIVAEVNDAGEWSGRRVTSDTEGAIPVTTIWGAR